MLRWSVRKVCAATPPSTLPTSVTASLQKLWLPRCDPDELHTALHTISESDRHSAEVSTHLSRIHAFPAIWRGLRSLHQVDDASSLTRLCKTESAVFRTASNLLLCVLQEELTLEQLLEHGSDHVHTPHDQNSVTEFHVSDALAIPLRRISSMLDDEATMDGEYVRLSLHFMFHILMTFHSRGAVGVFVGEMSGDVLLRRLLCGPSMHCVQMDPRSVDLCLAMLSLCLASLHATHADAADRTVATLPALLQCALRHPQHIEIQCKVWQCFGHIVDGSGGTSSEGAVALLRAWMAAIPNNNTKNESSLGETTDGSTPCTVAQGNSARWLGFLLPCFIALSTVAKEGGVENLEMVQAMEQLRCAGAHVLYVVLSTVTPDTPEYTLLMECALMANLGQAILRWLSHSNSISASFSVTALSVLLRISVEDPTLASEWGLLVLLRLMRSAYQVPNASPSANEAVPSTSAPTFDVAHVSAVESILGIIWNLLNRVESHAFLQAHNVERILRHELAPSLDAVVKRYEKETGMDTTFLRSLQTMCQNILEKGVRFKLW